MEIALVIKYLNEASLEKYPFAEAIKKYVGKLKSSIEINKVKKSFALTTFIAPKIAVNNNAWNVHAFPFIVSVKFLVKSVTKNPHNKIIKWNNKV